MNEFTSSKVAICSDLTKKFERVIYGQIEDVYEKIKSDEKIEKGEYTVVFEKKTEKEEEKEQNISLEALIIDYMIKENLNMKDAISKILEQNKSIKKNALYSASLNLKKLI
jgi:16S rRNA (cytidine1402-2'-O)-methyltransferase